MFVKSDAFEESPLRRNSAILLPCTNRRASVRWEVVDPPVGLMERDAMLSLLPMDYKKQL